MDKPLNERIQAAIKAGKSQGVEALIFEAEAASKQAVEDHGAARERALDPLLSDDEIAAARKAMEDADFTRERMTKAAAVLREKLTEFRKAEDQAVRSKIYNEAIARRNAASARLQAEYTDLANRLGDLLADVVAADAQVDIANRQLPSGANRIAIVEQHARPNGDRMLIAGGPWLTSTIRLPAFGHKLGGLPIWGPDNSLSRILQFNPETTNAEKVHLTPKPRPGPAGSPDALASPVGNSKKEEAA